MVVVPREVEAGMDVRDIEAAGVFPAAVLEPDDTGDVTRWLAKRGSLSLILDGASLPRRSLVGGDVDGRDAAEMDADAGLAGDPGLPKRARWGDVSGEPRGEDGMRLSRWRGV